MKKSLVLFVALLTLGIASAQSKKSLEKEFLNLEKENEKISIKYNKKLQALESKITGEKSSEDDFGNVSEDGFGDMNFGEEMKTSTKEAMEMFVEMYDHNTKENGNYMDFIGEEALSKNKDYTKLLKEYAAETKKIETKMYEVAKKYLSKR